MGSLMGCLMRLSCLKYIFYKNEYNSVNTNEEMVNKQYENIKNEGDLKTRPRSNRERDRLDLLEYDFLNHEIIL